MLNVPEFLIVHHTGGTDADPLADTSHHTFEVVKAWHLAKGWEDIGYHYFIDKTGKLTAGRAENYHGAHALGYNTKSLGVCLAGNFDKTLPTQEQINTLKKLLSELRVKYNVSLENIVPHRKFANKTCYGTKLPDTWARSMVSVKPTKQDALNKVEELRKLISEL